MPWQGDTWIPHEVIQANATTDMTYVAQYLNTLTNDLFGVLILMGIFLIIFIAGSKKNQDVALASGLFISTILSVLMAAMNLIGDWVPGVMILATMGAVVFLYKGGHGNA